jgi:ribonuclease HI
MAAPRDQSPPGGTVVYTDGACIHNPGPGGWAWAVDETRYASGFEPVTTNQRMEITAPLRALEAIGGTVTVVSDSIYVVNCFRNRWWERWQRNGWKNAQRQPVANRDLWEPLVEEVTVRRAGLVQFTWVKGHAGDPLNELVDALANEAARNQSAVARP